jgi:hypothetical protein
MRVVGTAVMKGTVVKGMGIMGGWVGRVGEVEVWGGDMMGVGMGIDYLDLTWALWYGSFTAVDWIVKVRWTSWADWAYWDDRMRDLCIVLDA